VEGGGLVVASAGGQGSHQLHAMALADSLAVTPPEVDVARGDAVPVLLLGP
jgi:molybdopterin biosynthesis enzyme